MNPTFYGIAAVLVASGGLVGLRLTAPSRRPSPRVSLRSEWEFVSRWESRLRIIKEALNSIGRALDPQVGNHPRDAKGRFR